jgi:hypothetical protein
MDKQTKPKRLPKKPKNPFERGAKDLAALMVKTRLSPREISQRFGRPQSVVESMLKAKVAIPFFWLDDLEDLDRKLNK